MKLCKMVCTTINRMITPSPKKTTEVEDCGVLCLVILCIPFLIFAMWGLSHDVANMNYFKCPISLSNEICNGGTCYTRGSCICRSPLFFGRGCNVTLCPGFDAGENTVCGGHGVCAEAADGRIRSEPPACDRGDTLTGTHGWDSPKCLAYIKDAEDGILPLPQYTSKGVIVMMPTCTCSKGWTGRKCDVPPLEMCTGGVFTT
jgi:hypothetical protein